MANYNHKHTLCITDFLTDAQYTDLSDLIQKVIDENPNRTIYFPDGEYVISKPILTPADPQKSVSLRLDDFAIIRAADNWTNEEAMIRLGGKDAANDIFSCGTNYGVEGGIIDCRSRANGISIDSGRETYIRNTSIKNAKVGIHIKYGANSGSSDSDIFGVNITGTGECDSVGAIIEGYDNTLTNMRIGNVFVGVDLIGAGNILKNVHPLYYIDSPSYERYDESVGFKNTNGRLNWFDFCYSDQFATGFYTTHGGQYTNCYAYWYSEEQARHVALDSAEAFDGRAIGMSINSSYPDKSHAVFTDGMKISEDAYFDNIWVLGKVIKNYV